MGCASSRDAGLAAAPTPAGGLPGKAPPAGLALTATAGQQALDEQEDERLRLRALLASGALQQAPDQPRFTRITQLLAYLFEVPQAGVAIFAADEVFFLAQTGIPVRRIPRDHEFCRLLSSRSVVIVEDSAQDARFNGSPFAAAPSNLRFYAGVRLQGSGGDTYGALMVLDTKPRKFTLDMYTILANCAELVVRELERESHETMPQPPKLRREECFDEGVLLLDMQATQWVVRYASDPACALAGVQPAKLAGASFWDAFSCSTSSKANPALTYGNKVAALEGFAIQLTSKSNRQRLAAIFKPAGVEPLADSMASLPAIPSFVASPLASKTGGMYFACLSELSPAAEELPHSNSAQPSKQSSMLSMVSSSRPLGLVCASTATMSLTTSAPFQLPLPSSCTRDKMFGEVRLGALIGRGAAGRVHRAYWMGSRVAVKVLEYTPDDSDMNAILEACLSRDLAHPCIIQTYQWCSRPVGKDGGAHHGMSLAELWIMQEYAALGSLSEGIESGRFRTEPTAGSPPNMLFILLTARELAAAMTFLHGHDILHADLTGANVLLTTCTQDSRGFSVKVSDFGLARVTGGGVHKTQTYGTVTHQPPELLSEGLLSTAADVWACGVLLFELAQGRLAWKGMRPSQVINTVVSHGFPFQLNDDVPDAFKALVGRCLSTNPAARPSFRDILEEIELQLESLGVRCRVSLDLPRG